MFGVVIKCLDMKEDHKLRVFEYRNACMKRGKVSEGI
jgi:hypothetical protein